MNTFPLTISSPQGDLFSGDAAMLAVRGTEGELAVMAGHVPFVTAVVSCLCRVTLGNGEQKVGKMDGGVLTVGENRALLVVGELIWED